MQFMVKLLPTKILSRTFQRWAFVSIMCAAVIAILIANNIYYFAQETTTIQVLIFGFSTCTACIYLSLGTFIWLYTSKQNKPLTRCFFCFTYSLALAFAAETSAANNIAFFSILASISSIGALTSMSLFFFYFPELTPTSIVYRQPAWIRQFSIVFGCLVGGIASLCDFLYVFTNETQPILLSGIAICVLLISICAIIRILYSWRYCIHHHLPQQLQQVKWVAGGFILGSAPVWIFTFLPQAIPSFRSILLFSSEITTLPLIVFLLAFCTALLRYQLLIFSTYIRKGLIRLIRVMAYVVVLNFCLLLINVLQDLMGPQNPHMLFQYSFIALVALISSIISWKYAEPFVDFLFFQDMRRYRTIFTESLYSSLLSVDDIAQIIASTAIEAFHVPQVNLYLLDEVRAIYRLTPAISIGSNELFHTLFRQTLGKMLCQRLGQLDSMPYAEEIDLNHPAIHQLKHAPRPLFLQEMAPNADGSTKRLKLGRYLSPEGKQPGDTILLAPITIHKRLIGILVLGEREHHRTYASGDFAILDLLFNRFSPMLKLARIAAQGQQHNELLNKLYSVSSLASDGFMISTIEQTARRYAISVALAIAGRAEIWLKQTQGSPQSYTCIVSEGSIPRILSISSLPALKESDWNSYFFEVSTQDQALPSPFTEPPTHSYAWLPLQHDETQIGILLLSYARPHFFSLAERSALQLFANSVLAALENARITNELQASYKRQQDLDRMQDRFIDEVTRQLRIPLAELHTSIKQIEQQHITLSEQERGLMIKQAYKASEDLSMLLDTIFSVSAPRKDIKLEALELEPFIHAIIDDLNNTDQRITADIPEGTFISTDIFLFHQICTSILKQMLTYPHQSMKIYASHTYVHVYLAMECLKSRTQNETHITFSQALIKSLLQEINATLEVTITDTDHERITIGLPKAQAQDSET